MATVSHVSPWLAVVLRPIYNVFIRIYFRTTVVGPGAIPATGPVLIVPTHRARWDPFVLYRIAGRRLLRFLTSHDEFVGTQGWFMRRLGAFPVNTRRPGPDALRHCRELLIEGQALVIFPEGTIFYYPPGEVHPLKPGTAWLALDCQRRLPDVPIALVPVRIGYSALRPKFGARVELRVGAPIDLSGYLDRPEKEAIRELTATIQAALGDVVNTSTHERAPDRLPAADEQAGAAAGGAG